MKKMQCKDLREAWVSFFKGKDHLHLPSSSLLPAEDPTLLFTSAGMVPFKEYFNGTKNPPHGRIATIQKCLRTTDLESVGKTARHLTFFEMLGNFSFGDYFKKEAIAWAYEFSTKVLEIPEERIYISVYHEDDEAYKIWNEEIGIPQERIVRLGKEQNWWGPAGDSGPCGPCTELYYDRGEEICYSETGCKNPHTCKPGNDCDRFLEYWNLVFNEYFQDTDGNLHPLPKKGIDTGAGLERIVALLNGTVSVFETDELLLLKNEIRKTIESLLQRNLEDNHATQVVLRVLTDHIRSVTFAMSDGIFPENTGRGYVIRRIIRRALLFSYQLGVKEAFLYRIQPRVVEIYGAFYPELRENQKKVQEILLEEEQRFLLTLSKGMKKWEEFLKEHREAKKTIFDGEKAFLLYDTYGFPVEITVELAGKEGMAVDMETFYKKMENQKEISKQFQQWKDFQFPPEFAHAGEKTEFTGYDTFSEKGTVLAIITDNRLADEVFASDTRREVILITDRTNFYPEGGGQVGDTGIIKSEAGVMRVTDTKKKGDIILHIGYIEKGYFHTGDSVELIVDKDRRMSITYHHSATHLLHRALRDVLGDGVYQTGSLVAPDYLRFDFSYGKKMTDEQIEKVEKQVIDAIQANAPVQTKFLPLEEAKKTGALAFFGEKYGEIVRIVEMGEGGKYSMEFCGGCHVRNTGEIRFFHIIKESSPGAGNRRIEAVANEKAIDYFYERIQDVKKAWKDLKEKYGDTSPEVAPEELPETREEILKLLQENPYRSLQLEKKLVGLELRLREYEKKLKKQSKKDLSSSDFGNMIEEILTKRENLQKLNLYAFIQENADAEQLRLIADAVKGRDPLAMVFGVSLDQDRATVIFACTKKVLELGIDCNEILKKSIEPYGGKGGGKKDLAQGGIDKMYLEEVLSGAKHILKEKMVS